ncbi:acetate--CoA ligase [Alicyclobacillus ferrooxydans]|uniref:acetate--CoA ligase n=1 Tax=Alicyclobacillus ferrooxydans TaxID=471514 RepID=UPI0006D5856F|nr:acetate--CoA ligase [Alicyclobacillus ferrooxydans]
MTNTLVHPQRLREFFHPQSVALIGATDKSRWSLNTYNNLKNMNFAGNIYLVHPKHEVVHGDQAYKSLFDIPESIDLAFIMVPTTQVLRVMEECYQKGIQNLILLTSGFGEMGEEGLRLEQAVLDYAETHNQVILGPNGNGFVNYTSRITPYGLPLLPPLTSGPVGVVLQSGALASSVMALAQTRHVGLSLLVSMGNETMMSATDVVDYLIEDESTRVIAMFLETIRSPKEFTRVAKKALAYGKPIVALKIGRSAHSARTAMAHTGALVGDDAVNDAAMRQLGVVRVNSLEDLITTAGLLGYAPALRGRRMGVVTPSGGACDILSDRAEDEGLEIPEFAPETVRGLADVLPQFSTVHNPLDVTGYVVVDRYLLLRALEVVVRDPGVDFILCLTEPPRFAPEDKTPIYEQFDRLREVTETADKPIVYVSNTAVDISPFGRELVDRSGLHFMGGMEHGMTALGRAVWWYEQYEKKNGGRDGQERTQTDREVAPTSYGLASGGLEGGWDAGRYGGLEGGSETGACGVLEGSSETGACGVLEGSSETGACGVLEGSSETGACGVLEGSSDAGVCGVLGGSSDAGVCGNSGGAGVDVKGLRGTWSEYKARRYLEDHGVPVVPGALAASVDEAVATAFQMGFPVVMKVQSEDIAHKSDVGGVLLSLQSEADVRDGYARILANVEKHAPESRVEGILVSPMRSDGIELLVGIVHDPLWGHVLAVGLGGIMVEVLKDTSLRVLPVSRSEIADMLQELRGTTVLHGVRGGPAADLDQVADAIWKLADIAVRMGDSLQALEVNPLLVNGSQVEALDALITWRDGGPGE